MGAVRLAAGVSAPLLPGLHLGNIAVAFIATSFGNQYD
jgi:hypothetical protein